VKGRGLNWTVSAVLNGSIFYKQNITLVSNLFAANEFFARLVALNYNGSGSPRAVFHYNNILIEKEWSYPTYG
jgi:hypothetical protein